VTHYTPVVLMLLYGQSSITLLGFDPVAPLRFYTDAASP
jgi:hypothetical protein